MFGSRVIDGALSLKPRGRVSNALALRVLRELHPQSCWDLLELSVWAGSMWTGSDDAQSAFQSSPADAAHALSTELDARRGRWGIDHRRCFFEEIRRPGRQVWLIVLDDNGESAFDLALLQQLVLEQPELHLIFIVNRFPVSNNLSLDSLRAMLREPYFRTLAKEIRGGRATITLESQAFRSFEIDALSPRTLEWLSNSTAAYIKGQSFFETFQPTRLSRYYAFCVFSNTSQMLTGCDAGQGIVARVPKGRSGFEINGPFGRPQSLADIAALPTTEASIELPRRYSEKTSTKVEI